MKKSQKILIILTLALAFFLVYQPHFSYRFPFHVDEWHHIAEATRLANYGEYFAALRSQTVSRFTGLEIGFHFFLFLLSWVVNLVLFYKFLPAIWAAVGALVLFYVTYKKTGRNFLIAWLAMIFFASIKSNVNVSGLWFFTPLSFALPFIFLYAYFLTEGIEKQNKKFISLAVLIMVFLIPTHSISVLFILPALLIFLLINYRYVFKEYKFFLSFLVLPATGILFFKYALAIPWSKLLFKLSYLLQFRYGWGVLEVHNDLTEVYSAAGYLLAIVGLFFLLLGRNNRRHYFYLLWPLTAFILVIVYKLTGISYLSPYQRNLYYFAVGLPFLSAVGLASLIKWVRHYLPLLIANQNYRKYIQNFFSFSVSLKINEKYTRYIQRAVSFLAVLIISLVAIFFTFTGYYRIPKQLDLYFPIQEKDYQAIKFLSAYPPSKVMAPPFIASALYPIARHEPVGAVFFYGSREDVELFYLSAECEIKNQIIKKHQVKYIISPVPIDCGYDLIYQRINSLIYQVNDNPDE